VIAGVRVEVKPVWLRAGCLFELQLSGFGRDLAHLLDEVSWSTVVGDPFLVELGLVLPEPAGEGLAVDLGGPLVVGAVGLGRVRVAFAAGGLAAGVAAGDAAGVVRPMVASWAASSR
jgi:hypothetical protein